jgi:hypothetical protein
MHVDWMTNIANHESNTRYCADHTVQDVQVTRHAVGIPVNPVVPGMMAAGRVAPGPARSPSTTVVRLNFEVFAGLYQYCAYDSTSFAGFFSSLSNVSLGHHNHVDLAICANSMSGITRQAKGSQDLCIALATVAGTWVAAWTSDGDFWGRARRAKKKKLASHTYNSV